MQDGDDGLARGARGGAPQTVADIGEFALIEAITARLRADREPILGPGDDAAIVAVGGGKTAISTDVLVEGVDFRRQWSSGEDVGRHAAAASVADIEAIGAAPIAVVVALILPSDTEVDWVLDVMHGLCAEAGLAGAAVVGGDVSAGESIALAMTVVGDLDGSAGVRRSGAHVGDSVAVAGRLGWAAAGLTVLSRGFTSPRVLADAHRRPRAPYGQGRVAALAGATSMIDVSDGLVADLGHVARASGVVIEIDSSAIEIGDELRSAAAAFNSDPLNWIMTGGDDHALVATFPPEAAIPPAFVLIGRVEAGSPEVKVDGLPAGEWARGHEHFRK